jgi:hypothetical protein
MQRPSDFLSTIATRDHYVLENDFELLLVNPAHFKQVRSRNSRIGAGGTEERTRAPS